MGMASSAPWAQSLLFPPFVYSGLTDHFKSFLRLTNGAVVHFTSFREFPIAKSI